MEKIRNYSEVFSVDAFHGTVLLQKTPECCNHEVIVDESTHFRKISLFIEAKQFFLIEPICPHCGKFIKAEYALWQ